MHEPNMPPIKIIFEVTRPMGQHVIKIMNEIYFHWDKQDKIILFKMYRSCKNMDFLKYFTFTFLFLCADCCLHHQFVYFNVKYSLTTFPVTC